MKKAIWVGVAIGIAVAGAWGYGALVRQENDTGQPVQLLAVAEEQSLTLSFSRSGRLVTRVPEEGETVQAAAVVARIEQPGLAQDATDYERQRAQVRARELTRREDVLRLKAEHAQVVSEERRMGRLVREGIAPRADLETLQHRREAIAAGIRAREAEKEELNAEGSTLGVRLDKVREFEGEGTLVAPSSGTVLTRHHRLGEWVEAGAPIVTLQVEAPYLRAEVPEERLSSFTVGRRVVAWPQARPTDRFSVRVVSIKPRSEFATRKNWGLQDRDLRTFSVRLAPEGGRVVAGQTFVVQTGQSR
ncbi:MAG: efflux RND transporter periplasmic adaptor subunit [Thermoanaerobaculia bacterium]|nr:efflux RND transporter periplasmic adaptor subunit [Thermoanaerobaculia bacterium]